jgi:hypothetical protein
MRDTVLCGVRVNKNICPQGQNFEWISCLMVFGTRLLPVIQLLSCARIRDETTDRYFIILS